MPLDPVPAGQVLATMESRFQEEIKFFTDSRMQTTAHNPGVSDPESWTAELVEKKMIGHPVKGDRFGELERTLTALYNFFIVRSLDFDNAHTAITAAQRNDSEIPESEILSKENFRDLYDRTNSIINHDSDIQDIFICYTVYSDTGKSPRVKELLANIAKKTPETPVNINLSLGADALVVDTFHKLNDAQLQQIFPGFSALSQRAQRMFRLYLPILQACMGHIHFLERGPETYHIISSALLAIPESQRKEALDIIYLVELFDALGAQGQRRRNGSVTCTNSFYRSYKFMYASFSILLKELNSEDNQFASETAFDYYFAERAKWLGFAAQPLSPAQKYLTRLGCQLRGCAPAFGNLLEIEFKKLDPSAQKLLVEQLGFGYQGIECWTRVDYSGTILLNIITSTKSSKNGQPDQKGVAIALNAAVCSAMLVKKVAAEFPAEVIDRRRTISFGEIAFLATTDPGLFKPSTFPLDSFIFDPKQNKILRTPKKDCNWRKAAGVTSVAIASLFIYGLVFKRPSTTASDFKLRPSSTAKTLLKQVGSRSR